MAARTKAAKLKLKRGARLQYADASTREPNGRKSRRTLATKERGRLMEMAVMDTAVSRRIRHLGLVDNKVETAEKQALDPRRGSVLGRLLLDKRITQAQYDAGVKYGEDMARFYSLTGTPFPSARAQNLFAVRGDEGETTEDRARQARSARDKANTLRDLMLKVGDINTGRKVIHTVNEIVIMDVEQARGWTDFMIGLLKRGLNALGKHYGMLT